MRHRAWLLATFVPLAAVAPWACSSKDSEDLPSYDASTSDAVGSDAAPPPPNDAGGDTGTLACVRSSSSGSQKLLDLAVVTDSSGSLSQLDPEAGAPYVQQRNQFLDRLLRAAPTAGIRAAMTYFPKAASCDPNVYAMPYVPATDLPTTAFAAPVQALQPAGQSFVFAGLEGGYAIADAMHKTTSHELAAVLIVTDGAPISCQDGGPDAGPAGTFALAAAALAKGIPTHVALVPDPTGQPSYGDPLAAAGGTNKALVIEQGKMAASVDSEITELRANMGSIVSCRFPAPSDLGDGGPPMPASRVTVYTTADGNPRAVLPFVPSCSPGDAGPKDAAADAADAGAPVTPNGWTLEGSTLVVCPIACEPLQRLRSARIEIGVDCL